MDTGRPLNAHGVSPTAVILNEREASPGSAWGARGWWVTHAYLSGFHLVGISVADPERSAFEGYWHWVQGGFAAGMEWMIRTAQTRIQPRLRWPELASMVVARAYCNEPALLTQRSDLPLISCYAWTGDYHRAMGRRLRRLVRWARRRWPQHWFRWYVDSGPVAEKAWAWWARLGWIGRNGNLINPRLGSWIFLGVVLTDLSLKGGGPFDGRDRCGTCRRCMEVCPTGAIVADGVVDARRCISYWTIEHEGTLPLEIRPLLGTHIFGCDDCQTVCPWNRWAQAAGMLRIHPASFASQETVQVWLQMDETDFRRTFRGTPVMRLGYRRFLRNLVVALGNSGRRRWLEPLQVKLAGTNDPELREHIEWAIKALRGKRPQND